MEATRAYFLAQAIYSDNAAQTDSIKKTAQTPDVCIILQCERTTIYLNYLLPAIGKRGVFASFVIV